MARLTKTEKRKIQNAYYYARKVLQRKTQHISGDIANYLTQRGQKANTANLKKIKRKLLFIKKSKKSGLTNPLQLTSKLITRYASRSKNANIKSQYRHLKKITQDKRTAYAKQYGVGLPRHAIISTEIYIENRDKFLELKDIRDREKTGNLTKRDMRRDLNIRSQIRSAYHQKKQNYQNIEAQQIVSKLK